MDWGASKLPLQDEMLPHKPRDSLVPSQRKKRSNDAKDMNERKGRLKVLVLSSLCLLGLCSVYIKQ